MIRWLIDFALRPALAIAAGFSVLRDLVRPRPRPSGAASSAEQSLLWTALKRWWPVAAGLLAVAGIGGALVLVSGVVPIKASSGHWPVTAWFLDFAKSRSVATHTLGMSAPPLDDPALLMKGAGHYEFGCRPCHGSPTFDQPRIAAAMTPRPPDLRSTVREYDPVDLFYIVKHGIKFTGMPAWPAQERDDEVWAVVAFLQRLPEMDERGYEELAAAGPTPNTGSPMRDLGPQQVPRAVGASCARCHGVDGLGRGQGAFPRLAGQRQEYLFASLEAYARSHRKSGIMEPIAAGLGREEMREAAQYYASLPGAPPLQAAEFGQEIARGEAIAGHGVPDRLIPACSKCHGPGGGRRNPHYPRLSGQYPGYITLQLTLFKAQQRGGTPYHHLMHRVAPQLTDEQMRAVALYYASLPGTRDSQAQ